MEEAAQVPAEIKEMPNRLKNQYLMVMRRSHPLLAMIKSRLTNHRIAVQVAAAAAVVVVVQAAVAVHQILTQAAIAMMIQNRHRKRVITNLQRQYPIVTNYRKL